MREERKGCVPNKQQAVRREIIGFEDLVCLIFNPHVAVTDNFCKKFNLLIIVRLDQEHLKVFRRLFMASKISASLIRVAY